MEREKQLWRGSEDLIRDLWQTYKNANKLAEVTGRCRATCQRFLNGGLVRWDTAVSMASVSIVSAPCLFDQDGRAETSFW